MIQAFPVVFGGGERPSLDLNFAALKQLDPRVTFTRASSGTYIDEAGAVQTAGTNVPRFTHDPVTGLSLGLLIEEARTNLVLNSATLVTQGVTVAAVAHTLSFYGTGTVTLSGVSTAGPLVGTGVNRRVTLTFTPTAGTLTLTVAGSVTLAQLEAGAFATSYIATAGASATRAADVAEIVSTNFKSFYREDQGSFECRYQAFGTSGQRVVFGVGAGSFANTIYLLNSTANQPAAIMRSGGVGVTALVVAGSTSQRRVAFSYGQQGVVLAAEINLLSSSAVLSPPTGLTFMNFGYRTDGVEPFSGLIARVRYWPRRVSDSQLRILAQT